MSLKIDGIRKLIAEDKRSSERLKIPANVFYASALWYPVWTGPITVDDIGGDGLRFTIAEKLEKSSRLKLKIIFPGRAIDPIVVPARIVWTKTTQDERCQIGVQFYKMNPQDRSRYVAYICDRILLKYL